MHRQPRALPPALEGAGWGSRASLVGDHAPPLLPQLVPGMQGVLGTGAAGSVTPPAPPLDHSRSAKGQPWTRSPRVGQSLSICLWHEFSSHQKVTFSN